MSKFVMKTDKTEIFLIVTRCRRCTEVDYCSRNCETESWTRYHHVECCYLDLLHSVSDIYDPDSLLFVSGGSLDRVLVLFLKYSCNRTFFMI